MARSMYSLRKEKNVNSIFIVGIDHVVAKTTYLYEYVKSKGDEVTYFTSDTAGFSSGVEGYPIVYLNYSNFFNWLKILFYLVFYRPNHVELYFSRIYFETFPTVIFCRILRIPISVVSRGKDLRDHIEHRYIRRILTKYICRNANLILPKERSHVKVLHNFNLPEKTLIHEIHNGLPLDQFRDSKFKASSKTFLFLNAFRELRNLDLLIYAFHKLKQDFYEVKLMLVGSSLEVNFLPQERRHEERLMNLIGDLNLEKDIEIYAFNPSPWKDIEGILSFVLPADQVWLNNALLEAMAFSIPPIIVKAERAEDIVVNNETGLICLKDSDSIYIAMKKMIEDPERARIMGLNAKKKVKSHFSSLEVGKLIYSLYQDYLWKS